ncbi:unnamed protein product [Protopolystoma xenopodis]|uniref:Uncharacterized protein n=1 Tax=Protopolystoma xenopodis TaxID=117903 RepID=A0A448X8X2_9PLAT|nr:unnamed protein product [Protopolystoma xenopodis]
MPTAGYDQFLLSQLAIVPESLYNRIAAVDRLTNVEGVRLPPQPRVGWRLVAGSSRALPQPAGLVPAEEARVPTRPISPTATATATATAIANGGASAAGAVLSWPAWAGVCSDAFGRYQNAPSSDQPPVQPVDRPGSDWSPLAPTARSAARCHGDERTPQLQVTLNGSLFALDCLLADTAWPGHVHRALLPHWPVTLRMRIFFVRRQSTDCGDSIAACFRATRLTSTYHLILSLVRHFFFIFALNFTLHRLA